MTTAAYADATRQQQSADKKLAGAAQKASRRSARKTPNQREKTSAEKKLAGAAKASFKKKCIADTVGNP